MAKQLYFVECAKDTIIVAGQRNPEPNSQTKTRRVSSRVWTNFERVEPSKASNAMWAPTKIDTATGSGENFWSEEWGLVIFGIKLQAVPLCKFDFETSSCYLLFIYLSLIDIFMYRGGWTHEGDKKNTL
jgi:hypothetical protein